MRKYFFIYFLLMFTFGTSPSWGEKVFTNADIKRFDAYSNSNNYSTSNDDQPKTSTTVNPTPTTTRNRGKVLIKKQNFRWTEIDPDSDYAHYAWTVKLRSTFDITQKIYIEFRLLDKKGFVVELDNKLTSIAPHHTETYRGTGMLKKYHTLSVKRTETVVKLR